VAYGRAASDPVYNVNIQADPTWNDASVGITVQQKNNIGAIRLSYAGDRGITVGW
jgi:hypothetical protein